MSYNFDLDQAQHLSGLIYVQNCLQRLSADEKKWQLAGKEILFHFMGSQAGISKLQIVLPWPYYKLLLSLNIVYCKFGNFCQGFIFLKLCLCEVL